MFIHGTIRVLAAAFCVVATASSSAAQYGFVNWESAHVHPLDLAPGGTLLLAVNTPDARLEVFDVSGSSPVIVDEIPVGADPVSVRARTATEAWVVNHISDSISIVDLPTGRVRHTLRTEDEPADVIFAGTPQRAFVTCAATNAVLVFDPANLATAPVRLEIEGEDPRAMAVSADGTQVYVAIFESSNGTTILGGGHPGLSYPPQVVNFPEGPWGGVNPPPNDGPNFNPPINPSLPPPPRVSLIIRQDDNGLWKDDNDGDWTDTVTGPDAFDLSGRLPGWELVDQDVAVINTGTLAISYVKRLMNLCMAIGVNPANGHVMVAGTDATNEIRYVQNLNGKFVKDFAAVVNLAAGTSTRVDLNPHLDYIDVTLPENKRLLSLGDPRAIVFRGDGAVAWLAGMGSNNVIAVDGTGLRVPGSKPIDVGEGPTGLALSADGQRLYVLNKFESALSVVDPDEEVELERVPFYDPSPEAIKDGRKYLYDTHISSGTGHLACASCHPDARMDRLAWDLGDPLGEMKPVAGNNLKANLPSLSLAAFEDFHPMKGPMVTQTLQDIIGKEPFHWRGDMAGLEAFAGVQVDLQGDDEPLDEGDMHELEEYLATIHYPPNPLRRANNALPQELETPGHYTTGRFGPPGEPLPPGDAVRGLAIFSPPEFLAGNNACITCHTTSMGAGTDMTWSVAEQRLVEIPLGPNGEHHLMLVASDGFSNKSIKVPQLRNNYFRTGFNTTKLRNTAGFGVEHDGTADSTERHIAQPPFTVASDQDVADILAYILAMSGGDLPQGSIYDTNMPLGLPGKDTHAGVGRQLTLASPELTPTQELLFETLREEALLGRLGFVAKGLVGGVTRGYVLRSEDRYDSDELGEILTESELLALAAPGQEITFSAVVTGTELRRGIDRDSDGYLDRDEIDVGSNPADASSVPSVWAELGGAVPGVHGLPKLLGKGPLEGGGTVKFTLAEARESSPMFLIFGLSELNAPFKGGVLVPNPDLVIFGLVTDVYGTFTIGAPLPAILPTGMTLVVQMWVTDPAALKGFSAAPAISATVGS
jgi:DNA-binding beta-propeller fold protein YncE